MAERDGRDQSFFTSPMGLIVTAFVLWLVAGIAFQLIPFLPPVNVDRPAIASVLNWLRFAGAWGISLIATALFLVGVIRLAMAGAPGAAPPSPAAQEPKETAELLRSINDRLLLSDMAKRIAYRQQDRDALRKAIEEDIDKKDYEAALLLASEMGLSYGYREESERYREQIFRARAEEQERKLSESIAAFEQVLASRQWDKALEEARKVQRLFPDSPRGGELTKRVRDAREQHKLDLERRFLQASERDDVELAMELLKELDGYLSESEAEPFRETARGVIGKKRQNLGVQFKLAVHDREWAQAVRVGEQIIREFPNTRMADEVRARLDILRQRSTEEQAARTV